MQIDTKTNKITFAGDWHGAYLQSASALLVAHRRGSDTIFQLGDFGIWENDEKFLNLTQDTLERFGQNLYFIDGNHENFERLYSHPLDPTTNLRPIRPNIFHIPRATRFSVANFTFLALGGAYSIDRRKRRINKSYWPEEQVTEQEIRDAINVQNPVVDFLLTHDSPAPAPNPVVSSPYRQSKAVQLFGEAHVNASVAHRERLQPVFLAAQPKILLHGHYHEYWTGQYSHPSGRLTRVFALDQGSAFPPHHVKTFDLSILHSEIDESEEND